MIIIEDRPAQKGHGQQEHRLQAEMVMDFSVRFPERRGELIATFQEVKSRVEGSQKLSLGLIRGVADLLLVNNGLLEGGEVKCPGTYHDVKHLREQAQWLIKVPYRGFFIDSLEMFRVWVAGGDGICPRKVLEYLKDINTKQVLWGENLRL